MVERDRRTNASVNMTSRKAARVPPSSIAAKNARYAESEMVQWLGHLLWSAIGFITNGRQREPSPRPQQSDLPKMSFFFHVPEIPGPAQ
jgi:hypothetical protein